MHKKKNFITWITLCLSGLISGSCTNEFLPEKGEEELTVISRIEQLIAVRSPQLDETGNGSFATYDELYLLASQSNRNYAFTYTVDVSRISWNQLENLTPGQPIELSGCYPIPQAVNDGVFTFDIDKASEKDLLLASPARSEWGNKQAIPLTFRHAMHLLKIRFKSSDASYTSEELGKIKTQIQACSTCKVDLRDGTVVSNSASGNASFTGTGNTGILLIPQETSQASLKITIDGKVIACDWPATLSDNQTAFSRFESGKTVTLVIDCRKDNANNPNINIEGSVIDGWENQGEINGSITVPTE